MRKIRKVVVTRIPTELRRLHLCIVAIEKQDQIFTSSGVSDCISNSSPSAKAQNTTTDRIHMIKCSRVRYLSSVSDSLEALDTMRRDDDEA